MTPFTEQELMAREKVTLDYAKKRKRRPSVWADLRLLECYPGWTRVRIARCMERERMRWEAEQLRGRKDRAAQAKEGYLQARAALAAWDRLHEEDK